MITAQPLEIKPQPTLISSNDLLNGPDLNELMGNQLIEVNHGNHIFSQTNTWQPLGKTLLKVKLLVGPTCKIPRSTQRS